MLDNERLNDLLDPDTNHFDEFSENSNGSFCSYISISDFNRKIQNYKNGLSILNFNIRSFSGNFDGFICCFENFNSIPNILVLTETWFKANSIREINYFKDYHTVRSTHRSGGVSVYIKDNLNSKK